MKDLHETEVDGVRCFWVDTGRPTLASSLLFRQGTADEPFNESGWLHMLEHLALHDRGGGALSVNGSVSLLVTSLDFHGPVAAVAESLAATTAWLCNPAFDELDRERGVLRAEAGMRGNAVARALGWRYGARGPGVVSMGEPGLGRATPDVLRLRANTAFGRGNAILVLDGPPPPGLRLRLPDGGSRPPSPAVPCDDPLPAAYVEASGAILSGLVERSVAATVLPGLLERALNEKLRQEIGGAYAPWSHYEAVDQTRAVVFAGSDVNPELMPSLARHLLELVASGRDGHNEKHLREHVDAMTQALTDPYGAAALAWRAAHAVFQGREPESLEEILADVRALDIDAVNRASESFRLSLLLGLPGEATWQDQLPMLRQPTAPAANGHRFRHREWPASAATLVVGQDAVQLVDGDVIQSIEVERVVGMHAFADNRRTITCQDGWSISVDPSAWNNGATAVALLDTTIRSDLHLPHPAPPDPTWSPQLSPLRRWSKGFRRLLRSRTAAWIALALGAGFCVVAITASRPAGVICGLLFMLAVARELRHQD